MRVTNSMIAGQVLFDMQRSMRRLLETQTSMSSGRRINKPSDDPVGTVRDLGYRRELQRIDQFRRNIGQAMAWMNTYDRTLSDVGAALSTAKEIAVAMANDTYDDVARDGAANEVASIIEQVLRLSNEQLQGRSVFAGFKTRVTPFEANANGVVYRGDEGRIEFEVEAGRKQVINLLGSEVFLQPVVTLGEGADLNVAVTGSTLVADLHNGDGIDQTVGTFTITDRNLNLTATVDVTAATDINDVITAINNALTAAGITNLQASVSDTGNAIAFDTTANGLISGDTLLSQLRQGAGIDLDPGTIRVSDGGTIDVTVDLSGSQTISDVITAFNAQLAAAGVNNVIMSVNAAGTGLQIVDNNVPPLNRTVSNSSPDSLTAEQLGIVGQIGAQLVGEDLEPQVFFEIAEAGGTTASDLGILAQFTADYSGADLDPRLTATAALADLNNGVGINTGRFVLKQGERLAFIDLNDPAMVTVQDLLDAINSSGLDVTASINADGRGIQVINNDTTRSFMITEDGNGRIAKELGLFGGADVMSSLMLLEDTLRNNDREGAERLLEHLDAGMLQVLKYRATAGARAVVLENTDTRLQDLSLNFTERLSEVEDADFNQVVTELATREANYRAAIMAAGKIIQPSLLDFLVR